MEILATSALGAKRKLNMVCLHGKNTSKAIFEFQSRTFREKFGDVIDFHILEGPHNEVEPPLQVFLDRGFQAPFKSYYYTKEHLGEEPLCPFDKSANHSVGGLEESIKSYVDFSKEHGPFDGALTFSQGGLFARHMHRIVNTIDKEYWEPHFAHERVKLPKFLITFGGPFNENHFENNSHNQLVINYQYITMNAQLKSNYLIPDVLIGKYQMN